jgi:hypothetical protein
MKLLIIFILGLFLFSECSSEKKIKEKPVTTLIIGEPIDYQNSTLMIFPVGVYTGTHTFYDDKPNTGDLNYKKISFFSTSTVTEGAVSYTKYSNEYNDNYIDHRVTDANENANADAAGHDNRTDVSNLIFYDRKTGEKYKLGEQNMHITNFSFHPEFRNEVILYKIIRSDYNQDSSFNNADGAIIFISDKLGKNLVQISPDSSQFIDYKYYRDTNLLLIRSLNDSNKDHVFDMKDEFVYTRVELDHPGKGSLLFDKDFTDSLRYLIK